jgi:hypothetical protein
MIAEHRLAGQHARQPKKKKGPILQNSPSVLFKKI